MFSGILMDQVNEQVSFVTLTVFSEPPSNLATVFGCIYLTLSALPCTSIFLKLTFLCVTWLKGRDFIYMSYLLFKILFSLRTKFCVQVSGVQVWLTWPGGAVSWDQHLIICLFTLQKRIEARMVSCSLIKWSTSKCLDAWLSFTYLKSFIEI